MPTAPTTACSRCGEPITPGARFCNRCGADISGAQGQLTTMNMPLAPASADLAAEQLLGLLREATLGEYDIMGELGKGGMATVYLAHDIALDRKVAIKIMNPQTLMGEGMLDRFKREARTAASLSHPHIIPIYLVRETDRILYFVMKFVQGRGLDSIIREKGPLPIKMAQAILNQVGSALGYAHRRGIVHRDIKPANIMIDDEGWAVVTDFGIAKVAEARGLTMTGATVGTPYYMSPEQSSAKPITGASDQYSLGIVGYEMLTGKPPFTGDTIMEIMRAHFFEQPRPIAEVRPDCPAPLADAITKMLAKEAEQRFPSLEAAVTAVGAEQLEHDDPIRTQMVELAKTELHLKALPPTPRSPMPAGKRSLAPAGAGAAADISSAPTTPMPVGRRPPPRPAPAKKGSRAWLALPLLAAVGAGVYLGVIRPSSRRAAEPPRQPLSQAGAPSVADVQVAPASAELRVGERVQLVAQVFDDQGRRMSGAAVSWTSKNAGVARVDSSGAVVGVAAGIASIEATAGGRTGSAAVAVSAPTLAQQPPPRQAEPPSRPAAEPTQAAQPTGNGIVKLGTRGEAAVLFANDVALGTIASLQDWTVPAGRVRLSIRAAGCTSWDTTVTVATGAEVRIGYRSPTCGG
jgi:serine/threonine-protein kinase